MKKPKKGKELTPIPKDQIGTFGEATMDDEIEDDGGGAELKPSGAPAAPKKKSAKVVAGDAHIQLKGNIIRSLEETKEMLDAFLELRDSFQLRRARFRLEESIMELYTDEGRWA